MGAAAGSVVPGIGTAIGAGAGALVGLIGSLFGGSDDDETARKLLQASVDEYGNIDIPKLQKLIAQQQQGTEYDKIQEDPQLRGAETAALKQLMETGQAQGMDPASRSRLFEAEKAADSRASSRRAAVMDQAARMGGGPGQAIAAQLSGAADDADRVGSQSVQIAGDASTRALQALAQGAGLAGQVRGQDYRVASDRAQAQDAINRLNTNLRSGADYYNNELPQREFDNRMRRAGASAGARQTLAGTYSEKAARTRDAIAQGGQILNGAVNMGAGIIRGDGSGGTTDSNDSGVDPNQDGVDPRGYRWP
jgi:hypothetical protein